MPQDVFTGVKQLGEGYIDRYARLKETAGAGLRGEQSMGETAYQLSANIAGGLIADSAYQLLRTGASFATTPEQETKIAEGVGQGIQSIDQKAGISDWWKTLSPRTQRNISASSDFADVLPVSLAGKVKNLFRTPDTTPPVEQIREAVISAYKGESVSGAAKMVNSTVDEGAREKLVTDLTTAYNDSIVGDLKTYNKRLQEQAQAMSRKGEVVTQDDLVRALAEEGIVPDVRGKLADFTAEVRRLEQRQNQLFEQYRPIIESTPATANIDDFRDFAKNSLIGRRSMAAELDKAEAQLDRAINNIARSLGVDETGKLNASQIDEISRIANDRTKAYKDSDVFQADVFSELGRASRMWLQENVPDNSFRTVNDQWIKLQNLKETAENLQNAQIDVGLLGRAIGSYVTTVGATALAAPSGSPFVALLAGMLTKMGGDEVANWMRGNKFSPEIRDVLQKQVLEKDTELINRLKQSATDQTNRNFYDALSRQLPPATPEAPRSQVSSGATIPAGGQTPTGRVEPGITERVREGAVRRSDSDGTPLMRSQYPELSDAELQKLKTSEFRKILENAGVEVDDVTKAIAGGTIGILLASYLNEDGSMLPAFGAIMGLAVSRGGKLKMLEDAIEANMKRRNVLSAAGKEANSREMKVIDAQYKALVREKNKVRDSLSPGLGIKDVTKESGFKSGAIPNLTKDADLRTNRAVPMKDVAGTKFTVPANTVLKPKLNEKGNAVITVDGKSYTVPKNQYDNLKGQSTRAVASEFAPELKGTVETVRGSKKGMDDQVLVDEIYNTSTDELARVGELTDVNQSILDKYYQNPNQRNLDEVMSVLDENGIDSDFAINERASGNANTNPTKYSQYTLDGGENYREILIQAPETLKKGEYGTDVIDKSQTYRSSHWSEPNVIAHIRMNERTVDGKKYAFMEELQSDWARDARTGKDTPQNPLLKDWQIPTTKRALIEAVDSGADRFAWINGEQTSARYNLATHVKEVSWQKDQTESGGRVIRLQPKETKENLNIIVNSKGEITTSKQADWNGKKLDEVLGKGLADKIMEKETGTLSGDGLSFGGEWAKNLYDKQVRDIVKKLTGAEVKTVDMGLGTGMKNAQLYTFSGNHRDVGGFADPSRIKKGDYISNTNGNEYVVVEAPTAQGNMAIIDSKTYEKLIKEGEEGRGKIFEQSRRVKALAESEKHAQQYIDLTPEVKAKIQSKAPKFKMKDGVNVAMPLILAYFYGEGEKD
jgi:hypothetical protein